MSVMKLEYAEDIYDIPFEEDQNGLFHPKFTNYGRAQMTPLERKAVDLMNELDPTALDMVNISGLYLRIWKEIGKKRRKPGTERRAPCWRKPPSAGITPRA